MNRQQHFEGAEPQRKRRHSYACSPATPPREFFCPISKCLMTEPVLLLNTGVTLSRTALQAWLRTGVRSAHSPLVLGIACAGLHSHVLLLQHA